MALVSVIVPCFNASKTILTTLRSIQNQKMKDFECLIINDGSNDNSQKIVEIISDKDERFKLINLNSNKGVTYARNLGLELASSRYVSFLDSDDFWNKKFLEYSINFRKKKDYAITHSPYVRFKKIGKSFYGKIINPPQIINRHNIREKNHIPLLTAVLDRKIISNFEFKESRPEDYLLWLELIEDKNFHSESISLKGAFYRISDNQRSNNKIKSIKRIYKMFLNQRNLSKSESAKRTFIWATYNYMEKKNRFSQIDFLNENLLEEFNKLINL